MKNNKLSVVEAAAIKFATAEHLRSLVEFSLPLLMKDPTGRQGGNPLVLTDPLALLPTVSWTRILSLDVKSTEEGCTACEQNPSEDCCGNCTYSCRKGKATVLVCLRKPAGVKYLVTLEGFEKDSRLGVSIDELVEVLRVE